MTGLVRSMGRAAVAAAIAGTLGGAAVLVAEALAALNHPYAKPELGLALRATTGPTGAPEVRLVLLGDATALGVGVDRVGDTVGGQLAELLAAVPGGHRVHLSSVGVARSRSTDLATQVSRALLGERPDVAVVLIGANDVIGMHGPRTSAAYLGAAVRRLRDAGVRVVVGTCPDLGASRAFAPPLRQLVGWQAHRTGRAQARAAHDAGGVVVDLAAETGAVFRCDRGTLCFDGLHPSADGYRLWAYALFPAVAAAAAATPRGG